MPFSVMSLVAPTLPDAAAGRRALALELVLTSLKILLALIVRRRGACLRHRNGRGLVPPHRDAVVAGADAGGDG